VATIIQLQKKLEQTTVLLEQERSERTRLQVVIERIEEEVSAREPQIVQKEKEFSRMAKEHQDIARRLQIAVDRAEHDSAQLTATKRQLAAAEKRIEGLVSQVSSLLLQVEQLQGGASPNDQNAAPNEFTFLRVQELVQINQQLMKVVEETTGGGAAENDSMLDTALGQLKKLMAERERQEEKIRQQNNMIEVYRTQLVESEERRHLLERSRGATPLQANGSNPSPAPMPDVVDHDARRQVEELRRQLEQRVAELKSATETVAQLKSQLASKDLAFDAEARRSNTLAQSAQLLQAQLTDMKERHDKLTKQFMEMETLLTSTVRENALSKDQLAMKEHEMFKLKAQAQFLTETVQRFAHTMPLRVDSVAEPPLYFRIRYTQDLQLARTECDRFSKFNSDLQLILAERASELQSARAAVETEAKKYSSEIESLKREVESLKERLRIEESQLSLSRSEARQEAEVHKARLLRSQEELAAKSSTLEKAQSDLAAAQAEVTKLNARVTELATLVQQQEEALRAEQDAESQASLLRKVCIWQL
jgi:chromosome segregation ATPase